MRSAASRYTILTVIVFVMLFCLSGCGGGGSSQGQGGSSSEEGGGSYDIPEFKDVEFDDSAAVGGDGVLLDTSHSSSGYFAALCEGDQKVKLCVNAGDTEYIYDLPSGDPHFFPFQAGDGDYHIRAMQNVSDNKYAELWADDISVSLDSEFEPFLRPGQFADYTKDSECVATARKLAESASDTNDFITKVYDYIKDNISYDKEKAMSVSSGYIPEPDETLSSGKGICFDYACLGASMLRSQGVPTKIIFGYVGKDADLYHAWNMYYSEESGWVAVEFAVDPKDWNRLDLTFSAGGENSEFIGDGSNYTDVFEY